MKKANIRVKIDAEKLRDDIVKKMPVTHMGVIIGRSNSYFAPTSMIYKTGTIPLDELRKICLVLGKELSDYTVSDEEEPVREEQKPEQKPEAKPEPKPDKSIEKIYDGIEMNGQAIGNLKREVEETNKRLDTLLDELRKIASETAKFRKEWENVQKYGRF